MNIETAMKYLVNVHNIQDSKENRKHVLKNWNRCKEIAGNSKIGGPDGDYFYCGTEPLPIDQHYQKFIDGQLITYFQENYKNG